MKRPTRTVEQLNVSGEDYNALLERETLTSSQIKRQMSYGGIGVGTAQQVECSEVHSMCDYCVVRQRVGSKDHFKAVC